MFILLFNFSSMLRKSFILFFCVGLSVIHAESHALKTFVDAPQFAGANLGVSVKEVKTGKVILEYCSGKSLIPASNMKLLTTATALELLGPDFRFETSLEYDGSIDAQGTLHGNIYIVGSGDPTIGSEVFGDHDFITRWVEAVRKAGIKKVDGRIVANVSAFDREVTSPDWTWQNMGNYFAAGVYGLSLYDNSYTLTFKSGAPGTTPKIIGTSPAMYELNFHNFMIAAPAGEDDDDGYIHGAPYSNERTITGTIPPNRAAFSIKGDMPNPPIKLATLFTEQLNNAGIFIAAPPIDELLNVEAHTCFYIHKSPALAAIIKETNRQSNNLFAEHLFKRLALINHTVATREEAAENVTAFWKKQGADVSFLFLHDGCGLSPINGVSPDFFVRLLTYMRTKSRYKETFFASLPVAGVNGTLKNFLAGTSLEGKVMAKSGSIRRVLCFSGYIELKGKEYVFSIMVNNYSGSSVDTKRAIEKLLLSLE